MDDIESEKPQKGLEKYTHEFLMDRKDELEKIKDLLNSADLKSIYKIAHKWKGYSQPYGFHRLESFSLELENLVLDKNVLKIKESIKKIESYLQQKEKILNKK